MATASFLFAVAALVVLNASFLLQACELHNGQASMRSLRPVRQIGTPGTHNCTERYFDEQKLDHFTYRGGARTTWSQRYLIYEGYWKPDEQGPIFFYGAAI